MDERAASHDTAKPIRRHRSDATRARIMAAAEDVFARDGVATGSMAAILRAAGQRNETAIVYHFGSREGLALAIIEAHREPVAAYRKELISQATAGGRVPDRPGSRRTAGPSPGSVPGDPRWPQLSAHPG